MTAERSRPLQCAIYTRKSSEEGLEQAFNSLDAQREACAAYIESQRHEGWKLYGKHYDDGGYSRGNMDRPALGQLLTDIDRGLIDIVVVYKVDRLTRALNDFARIVQTFDAHKVSFVSVTQQFNTTSSMGRLTLNVLLSFAQFEREVTGERIRDKIAASKRKGMWMGGRVPLGYDLIDRKLITNPIEAELVRHLFQRYAELESVDKLQAELVDQGVKSKVRVSKTGKTSGGATYSRGALYDILQNRLYLGETTHKEHTYPGEHSGVVPQGLWDRVQRLIRANHQFRRTGANAREPSLLTGLLFDEAGNRMTPSHAVKSGKRYRYYVSQALIQHRPGIKSRVGRVPAHDVESLVVEKVHTFLSSCREVLEAVASEDDARTQADMLATAKETVSILAVGRSAEIRGLLLQLIAKTMLHEQRIEIQIAKGRLRALLLGKQVGDAGKVTPGAGDSEPVDVLVLTVDASIRRCRGEIRLIVPGDSDDYLPSRRSLALIKAVARAHHWYQMLITGETRSLRAIAKQIGTTERYVGRIVRCAFLAPDIVEAILVGRQPPDLTLDKLLDTLPADWAEQRRVLGFKIH